MQLRHYLRYDALWCGALALLILGHFWFPQFGTGDARDTYGTGANGKKLFYRLMQQDPERRGFSVQRNTDPLAKLLDKRYVPLSRARGDEPTELLCILGPARYPNIAEWDVLLQWVRRGGNLIIAANGRKPEFKIEKLKIKVRRSKSPIDGDALSTNLISSGRVVWQSNAEIIASPRARRLLSVAGTTQAIRQQYNRGTVVVVASDFIFSNQSVAFGDFSNAVLALRLLEAAGDEARIPRKIIFDEALNISGRPQVVGLLLKPEFKPMTLQLLIGIVLFAWWGSRRFGPPLPESSPPRQNVVDHTDAVGTLLYRAGDGTAALRAYLRQLFAEIKLKMHRGKEERVIEPLAYKLGKDPEVVKRLLQRAARATKTEFLDRREAARLLRQLAVVRRAAQQTAPRRREPAPGPPPLTPAPAR